MLRDNKVYYSNSEIMNWLIEVFIVLVALLHLYFLWFEMFAWTTKGRKIFRNFPSELFEPTKSMAANQGLTTAFWP